MSVVAPLVFIVTAFSWHSASKVRYGNAEARVNSPGVLNCAIMALSYISDQKLHPAPLPLQDVTVPSDEA